MGRQSGEMLNDEPADAGAVEESSTSESTESTFSQSLANALAQAQQPEGEEGEETDETDEAEDSDDSDDSQETEEAEQPETQDTGGVEDDQDSEAASTSPALGEVLAKVDQQQRIIDHLIDQAASEPEPSGEKTEDEDEDLVFHSETERVLHGHVKSLRERVERLSGVVDVFVAAINDQLQLDRAQGALREFDEVVDKLCASTGITLSKKDREQLRAETAKAGQMPVRDATERTFHHLFWDRPAHTGKVRDTAVRRKEKLVDVEGRSTPTGTEGETEYTTYADAVRAHCRKVGLGR